MTRFHKLLVASFTLLCVAAIVVSSYYCFLRPDPAVDYTAIELYERFNSKPIDPDYLEKTLTIKGEVLWVNNSWTTPEGWMTVALGRGDTGVLCDFAPAEASEAGRLTPGSTVILSGVCKGKFMNTPMLSQCTVLRR